MLRLRPLPLRRASGLRLSCRQRGDRDLDGMAPTGCCCPAARDSYVPHSSLIHQPACTAPAGGAIKTVWVSANQRVMQSVEMVPPIDPLTCCARRRWRWEVSASKQTLQLTVYSVSESNVCRPWPILQKASPGSPRRRDLPRVQTTGATAILSIRCVVLSKVVLQGVCCIARHGTRLWP